MRDRPQAVAQARTGRTVRIGGLTALAGLATAAWSLHEARRFTLRSQVVPMPGPGPAGGGPAGGGPAGADQHGPQLRILHLSDLHLVPDQQHKAAWLRGLAALEPDLTVVTGDFLADAHAVSPVLEALSGLLARPGAFVLGSNDYYEPRRVNPLKYFLGPSRLVPQRGLLPWGDLVAGLVAAGWVDLGNRSAVLQAGGWRVALRGVDDPHIQRDDYAAVAGPFPAADLRLGVVHAPYLRILDPMAADGADLVLAGHTHGGQVCLPGGRALLTNCDLDVGRVRGLHRHLPGQRDARQRTAGAFLHVSAGLGTAPSAPFRLFCRPEATLLRLRPALG